MAVLVLAALAGCAPPALTLNRPALRATAARTIAAVPVTARWSWPAAVPYWNSGTGARFEDPAFAIRANLLQGLADRYALEVVDDRKPDLVLDVETTRWDFRVVRKGAFGAAHVVFVYGATLTLKDRRTEQVLAEGSCDIYQTTPPTTDPALHDPALFRAELRKTAAYCTADFRQRTLGL